MDGFEVIHSVRSLVVNDPDFKSEAPHTNILAASIINVIVIDSQWFLAEPWPDNQWTIKIKSEYYENLMNRLSKKFGPDYIGTFVREL